MLSATVCSDERIVETYLSRPIEKTIYLFNIGILEKHYVKQKYSGITYKRWIVITSRHVDPFFTFRLLTVKPGSH